MQDHYILVVKPHDNEFGGPIISTLIDLTASAFKYDSPFFTIGTRKITADMYFEDSQMVYSIQNSARSEECEEFLDSISTLPG